MITRQNLRQPKQISFTKEGLDKLKLELIELQEKRPAAVLELKRAREMGDLSENGLYKAARMQLTSIDASIRRKSAMAKLADVKIAPKDSIGIGSTILVEQNGKEVQYKIVGDFEADPLNKKISSKSPIGFHLIGKKKGDEISLQTPNGSTIIKVLNIG